MTLFLCDQKWNFGQPSIEVTSYVTYGTFSRQIAIPAGEVETDATICPELNVYNRLCRKPRILIRQVHDIELRTTSPARSSSSGISGVFEYP